MGLLLRMPWQLVLILGVPIYIIPVKSLSNPSEPYSWLAGRWNYLLFVSFMIKRKLILFFTNYKRYPLGSKMILEYGKIHRNPFDRLFETRRKTVFYSNITMQPASWIHFAKKAKQNGNRKGFRGYHFTTVLPNQYQVTEKTVNGWHADNEKRAGTNSRLLRWVLRRTYVLPIET
jgi:hypothetical protein